jgi:hypothetical protein
MYRVTIPGWTNKNTGETKLTRSFNAELVETLLANSPQPSNLIFKYYGEYAPASVFQPSKHDRLVFKRGEDDYIIIPNIPPNRHLWSKLDA